jgi:hypothetical protein
MHKKAELAEQILAISKQSWVDDSIKDAALSQLEFLALEYLSKKGTTTVGEIRGGHRRCCCSNVPNRAEPRRLKICNLRHQSSR